MKYIIIGVKHRNDSIEREWPIIFPDNMVHSLVSDAIKGYFADEASDLHMPRPEMRIVSAGNISFDLMWCSGKSESLKVESRPDDEAFIGNIDYNAGIR